MEGLPYRLYMDASDKALGCSLQQVQPIRVGDLKGTQAYMHLKRVFESGLPPPHMVPGLSTKCKDHKFDDKWATEFDETIVHIERVIAYWSRLFKNAETLYSTTEWAALATKEGLVKFQPFVEGESILLITDHSALQWARTYENANRQLAAWGAVFSAYALKLEIIHRAGQVHSNIDPLSRLPRAPPTHVSPLEMDEPSIQVKEMLDECQEVTAAEKMVEFTFATWSIEDCLDEPKEVLINVQSRNKKLTDMAEVQPPEVSNDGRSEDDLDELDTLKASSDYWGATNLPPTITLAMSEEAKQQWKSAYLEDPMFRGIAQSDSNHCQYFSVPPQFLQDWPESCRTPQDSAGLQAKVLILVASPAKLGRT